jgi:hypothetical protein
MRAEWSTEDLVGSWTLLDEDWRLVGNKSGPTRLGFALLLNLAGSRHLNGFALVLVQHDRVPAGVLGSGLASKDPLALGVEQTFLDELGHRAARGERRVQAQPWVGPLDPVGELLLDEAGDALVADRDEPGRESPVVIDHLFMDLEYVHSTPSEF